MSPGPDHSSKSEERYGTPLTRAVAAVTAAVGSFPAIALAVGLILMWLVGLFLVRGGFLNQNYQLVINTLTTIITFLMVFVIQNTQNRDGRALQTKLDAQTEALAAIAVALNIDDDDLPTLKRLIGVEDAPEADIRDVQQAVRQNAERHGRHEDHMVTPQRGLPAGRGKAPISRG